MYVLAQIKQMRPHMSLNLVPIICHPDSFMFFGFIMPLNESFVLHYY
jgi:hypothetical protein